MLIARAGVGTQRAGSMEAVRKALKPYTSVVVTGGSSGIGKSFIQQIDEIGEVRRVFNLSRSEPAIFLQHLRLHHLPTDLSDAAALAAQLNTLNHLLDAPGESGKILLINNSGFGGYGLFPEPNIGHQLGMIDVNVRAPVQILAALLPALQRRGGAVLNIASTAAWQPTPFMATYGATKAFLLNWSLAVNQDLKPWGIPVLAVCPGPTESNFFRRAGFGEAPIPGYGETAETVVRNSLRALGRRRSYLVSGWPNKLLVGLGSKLPRAWQAPIAAVILRRMRLESHLAAQAKK